MNQEDIRIDLSGTTDEAASIFTQVFGDAPDLVRLSQSMIHILRKRDGTAVAAAAVEQEEGGIRYCWLLAVSEGYRAKGLGGRLLREVVDHARGDGATMVWLKTYQKRIGMQAILRRDGWFLCGAERAGRFDGVREIWRYPIAQAPKGIIVIGANPTGRGGEWVERIQAMPELWTLKGIVEQDDSHRAHWERIGIPTYQSLDDPGALIDVSATIIAVPPTKVAQVQRECVKRGIAILVEKPLAGSLSELADLQDSLMSAPVPLVVGVQRRSHPSYVALRAALESEHPTELSVRISLGRPSHDQPAGHRVNRTLCRGGALLDLGYHALDLVHFLLGKPLEMVSCFLASGADLATGIESSATLLGRSGSTWVRVEVDRHGGRKLEEVRARTSEGVWIADREQVLAPDGSVFYQCSGSWEAAESGRLVELAGAVSRGGRLTEDLWEHLAAFELIERAYAISHIQGLEGFGV
jgi:predicted dehydrogenase/GNAT superfamily N-acetyltransferase